MVADVEDNRSGGNGAAPAEHPPASIDPPRPAEHPTIPPAPAPPPEPPSPPLIGDDLLSLSKPEPYDTSESVPPPSAPPQPAPAMTQPQAPAPPQAPVEPQPPAQAPAPAPQQAPAKAAPAPAAPVAQPVPEPVAQPAPAAQPVAAPVQPQPAAQPPVSQAPPITPMPPPPGWYGDIFGNPPRWWDGTVWTEHVLVPLPATETAVPAADDVELSFLDNALISISLAPDWAKFLAAAVVTAVLALIGLGLINGDSSSDDVPDGFVPQTPELEEGTIPNPPETPAPTEPDGEVDR